MIEPPDAQRILDGLTCGRTGCSCQRAARVGRGRTHCPAHEDRSPSLSVACRDDRVLVHCFGSCFQGPVIEALRARNLWPQLQLRVARLPMDAKDVAELLARPGGDAAYERMIAEAQPAVAWMVDQAPRPRSLQFRQLGHALEQLDLVERTAYVRLLAERLDVPEPTLRSALDDYLDGRRRLGRSRVVRS